LEERLAEAREIIDIQLDDLMETREQLQQANGAIYKHILVLQNLRRNFIRP
jgi:hypothetical protein